ncbi:MAG: hypothetical protein EBQ73_02250, partial [Gammaproteobacteria bacterium]|nr:hypothetical protein [Gammaproteobacteria bacterium]
IACLHLFASEGIPLDQLGLSGSLLLGAQGPDSDVDLVTYDRALFRRLQVLILKAMEDGRMAALTPRRGKRPTTVVAPPLLLKTIGGMRFVRPIKR